MSALLRLERGNIRNRVTPLTSDEASFEVYTPGAVAAVRGTEYYLGVDGAETTRNEVISGQVDVGARGTTREVEGEGFRGWRYDGQSPHWCLSGCSILSLSLFREAPAARGPACT